jgi:CRISPR/Cas system CMR-associated protein Cmr1 (group 7 of RAMP superfamily)
MPAENGRGGRKRKPADPMARKIKGTYKKGGASALKRPATEFSETNQQKIVLETIEPATESDAGLGIKEVMREVTTVSRPK